jgi:hypothetical protein
MSCPPLVSAAFACDAVRHARFPIDEIPQAAELAIAAIDRRPS